MDTVVTIELCTEATAEACEDSVARAYGWFEHVERQCSRFDPASELSQLCARPGKTVSVSPLLYHLVDFALSIAGSTAGAFDPSVGASMLEKGFNRNYVTGETVANVAAEGNWRDIHLDSSAKTIRLSRPLVLDLGAVAKGMAADLAAKELAAYKGYVIDAGGDVLTAGLNPSGGMWRIGIRHPRQLQELIDVIEVSNLAVCTSGDYERRSETDAASHHILDPRSGDSPSQVVSATVVAPLAMAADALSTAALVLGSVKGIRFVRSLGAECLIVTEDLRKYETPGFAAYRP